MVETGRPAADLRHGVAVTVLAEKGESAEDAAKAHKSRHPDHFPVARNDLMGEKIYG